MVITGAVACGHVIEGITTEHYFSVKTILGEDFYGPQKVVMNVVRLQGSYTVSDQHFSSFAIYNSQDDLDIRASRLDQQQDYRSDRSEFPGFPTEILNLVCY